MTTDEQYEWDERAAILEYEAGMSREAAEREATRQIREKGHDHHEL